MHVNYQMRTKCAENGPRQAARIDTSASILPSLSSPNLAEAVPDPGCPKDSSGNAVLQPFSSHFATLSHRCALRQELSLVTGSNTPSRLLITRF